MERDVSGRTLHLPPPEMPTFPQKDELASKTLTLILWLDKFEDSAILMEENIPLAPPPITHTLGVAVVVRDDDEYSRDFRSGRWRGRWNAFAKKLIVRRRSIIEEMEDKVGCIYRLETIRL